MPRLLPLATLMLITAAAAGHSQVAGATVPHMSAQSAQRTSTDSSVLQQVGWWRCVLWLDTCAWRWGWWRYARCMWLHGCW